MLSHNNNTLKVQQVVVYAAAGDSLTEAYNNSDDEIVKQSILNKVKEFNKNLRLLPTQEFIQYVNKLIEDLNQQDTFNKRAEYYKQFCHDLLFPSEESQKKMADIFNPAINHQIKYEKDHKNICYLLRSFVDCHDEISLKAMFQTIPMTMKNEMLYSLLPKWFISAALEFNAQSAHIALELGMPADTTYPWRNFFGDTLHISLLTHLVYQAGQMISRVSGKQTKDSCSCHFNDEKLNAYAAIIKDLISHGADCDFDKRGPSDHATPRGLAASKLQELNEDSRLSAEDKQKMTNVLRLVADNKKTEHQAVESELKRLKC